jgi:large subunit ribosomal protein L18
VINKESKNIKRKTRHLRVRKKVFGTPERPRVSVYRSLKNMYAQLIDDTTGSTLVSASTLDENIKGKIDNGSNKEAAKLVGQLLAQRALEKGIHSVVFDRGGYIYHGRVKELAEGARDGGLQF